MTIEEIIDKEPFRSDHELQKLLFDLNRLQSGLNELSKEKFDRINPFLENLFDWKQKGKQLFGKEKNITVYDSCSIVGDVQVGENTWIGPYTALDGTGGLRIGKNCSISSGVQLVSHDTVKWALSGGKHAYEYGAVEIGDNCFIGTNAFIGRGVKIGDHCLIGAGAIVTKDVPDRSIALGTPAKIRGRVIVLRDSVDLEFFSA